MFKCNNPLIKHFTTIMFFTSFATSHLITDAQRISRWPISYLVRMFPSPFGVTLFHLVVWLVSGGYYWMGLTDAATEGTWTWTTDNSVATYTGWGQGE